MKARLIRFEGGVCKVPRFPVRFVRSVRIRGKVSSSAPFAARTGLQYGTMCNGRAVRLRFSNRYDAIVQKQREEGGGSVSASDESILTMGASDSPDAVYDARTLGAPKMAVFGLQHMFAMFGATILVPILTGLSVSTTLHSR